MMSSTNFDAPSRRTQAGITWLLMALAWFAGTGFAQTSTSAPSAPCAGQLSAECHGLLARVVKRPYGWGWPASESAEQNAAERRLQPTIAMGRGETPAAGLVLKWAGEFLDDADLKDAAKQVTRGVAAAQTPAGMIMHRPLFGTNAGGPDERAYVPHRQSTVAALGLFLDDIDPNEPGGPSRSAALRAAGWLVKQQTQTGGWPIAHPPNADPKDSIRIERLDDTDFRDCTLALLLAAEVTENKLFDQRVRRSIEMLLRMRLLRPPHSAGLWSTAYSLDGSALDQIFGFPEGADVLASKYCLQTLIAAAIVLNDASYAPAMENAAAALKAVREADGTWQRFIDPLLRRRATTAKIARAGVTTQPVVDFSAPPSDFGLEPTLAAVAKLQSTDLEKYKQELSEYFTPRQHLAAAIAGLNDDPLVAQLPLDEESARHAAREIDAALQKLESSDLNSRTARIWLLLVRAKIERRFKL